MGELCYKNPVKCTAAMALAGYTAYNMAENSIDQQACITKCLPPNWPQVVDSNGETPPEYFSEDPAPLDDENAPAQPQCTEGTDCEPYCVARCQEEHPTTLVGAALEGAGEMMDDLIVPFVEDVLGIPITDLGNGALWGIRIGVSALGMFVLFKVLGLLGLWGGRGSGSSTGSTIQPSMRDHERRPLYYPPHPPPYSYPPRTPPSSSYPPQGYAPLSSSKGPVVGGGVNAP